MKVLDFKLDIKWLITSYDKIIYYKNIVIFLYNNIYKIYT
jgi:hypothetical protein